MKKTSSPALEAIRQASAYFPPYLPYRMRQNYFLSLLFYKALCDQWLDDFDEVIQTYPTNVNPEYSRLRQELLATRRFIVPPEAHFASLLEQCCLAGNATRIDHAFALLMLANPVKLSGLFRQMQSDHLHLFAQDEGDAMLCDLLQALNQSAFDLRPSNFPRQRMAGEFFSDAIEEIVTIGQPVPQSCPTPKAVADLMASLLAPEAEQTIYDPACGTGALLLACGRWIRNRYLHNDFALCGQETSADKLRIARMQLLLYGMDNHQLLQGDTLVQPLHLKPVMQDDAYLTSALQTFDIALCNPPDTMAAGLAETLQRQRLPRFHTIVPEQHKAQMGFVLHMLASLTPQIGRMAALVPFACLLRGGSDGAVRQYLIEKNVLDAVIHLPNWLFPSRDRDYAILLVRQNRRDDKVCMMDAAHIAPDDYAAVTRLADFYQIRQDVPGYARMVPRQEIIARQYELDALRYIQYVGALGSMA